MKQIKLRQDGQVLAYMNNTAENLLLIYEHFNLEQQEVTDRYEAYNIRGVK